MGKPRRTFWPTRGLSGKEFACQHGRQGFDPWVGKIPRRRKWKRAPIFLPEKFHGQRTLVGYGPRGHKESDRTEWLSTQYIQKLKKTMLVSDKQTGDLKRKIYKQEYDIVEFKNICEVKKSWVGLEQFEEEQSGKLRIHHQELSNLKSRKNIKKITEPVTWGIRTNVLTTCH